MDMESKVFDSLEETDDVVLGRYNETDESPQPTPRSRRSSLFRRYKSARTPHGSLQKSSVVYSPRGTLNETFRRAAVSALGVTESYPDNISKLDFLSLIPNELKSDSRVINDIVRRLTEACRHRQRIARANFIYMNKAPELFQIFRDCTRREDQCSRLSDLIANVRAMHNWKGSMPSVEWFLRRKSGIVRKNAAGTPGTPASGPAAPHKLLRSLETCRNSQSPIPASGGEEVQETKHVFDESEETPNCNEYIRQFTASQQQATSEVSESTVINQAKVNVNGVSTTIISTEELHLPNPANAETGLLTEGTAYLPNLVPRDSAVQRLTAFFNNSSADETREYMALIRQAFNRRLAEEAVDLMSKLSSTECAQFLQMAESHDYRKQN